MLNGISQLKKYIATGAAILVVCVGTFILGFQSGISYVEQRYQLQTTYLNVLNAIAGYSIHADTANALVNQNFSKALCLVNIQASAQVNKVRQCLEQPTCRETVEAEIQKIAPELLGHGELKIRYIKEGELCK